MDNKIKIGLFGFGVVGQGIYKVLQNAKNAHAEISKICVRSLNKPRSVEAPPSCSPHRPPRCSMIPKSI